MSRGFWPALLVIALVALALRLPQLDRRPMHGDEAVHADKFRGLWQSGVYKYDLNEYHGPTLYYVTLPVVWLSSAKDFADLKESTLRLVPVIFGVGLVLLLGLLHDALGREETLCAAALTAISPAMVFYSRYYIHEMLLVFCTLLFLGSAWRYARSPRLGWALLAGASLGLMHATKETCVIALAAMAPALAAATLYGRWLDSPRRPFRLEFKPAHGLAALGVAVMISVTLFSSFFANMQGPVDSVRTYLPWLNRAGVGASPSLSAGELKDPRSLVDKLRRGSDPPSRFLGSRFSAERKRLLADSNSPSPHLHPWDFYLERLFWFHHGFGPVWSEALILGLALVGLMVSLRPAVTPGSQTTWLRFAGFYTVALTAAYSAIAYKTPWCALGFLHGMILLAGVGAVALVRLARSPGLRFAVGTGIVLATAQLGVQSWRASFVFYEDRRNPYVYAQAVSDVRELADRVAALARVAAQGPEVAITVAAPGSDYWPLPWYLRGFAKVGWYSDLEAAPDADVFIASPRFRAALNAKLGQTHQTVGLFGLRPGTFLQLFVRRELWRDYTERLQATP